MPVFEVELEDGRVVELESESEPTPDQVYSALQSHQPAPEPAWEAPPELINQFQKQEQERQAMTAYYGPGKFSPGGPETGFTSALYQQFPSDFGEIVHKALSPIEYAVRPAFEQIRQAFAPTTYGMTGEMPAPLKPDESYIAGLTPGESERGVIPSLRRAGAGMTTPGMLATLPFAPHSKLLTGAFFTGAAASVPGAIEGVIQAQTPEELRGAYTDLGLSTAFTGLMGKTLAKKGGGHASQVSKATTLYGNVPGQSLESTRALSIEEGRPGVRPQASEVAGKTPSQVLLRPEEVGEFTPEEHSALIAAQERMGEGHPINIVSAETLPEGEFKHRQWGRANFTTGQIDIIPSALRETLRNKKVPIEEWPEEIQAMLGEEEFHFQVFDAIGDRGAASYWNNLTSLEQRLATYYYAGYVKGAEFSPSQMGHEVLRRRLQVLSGLEPTELRRTVRAERWTLKGIQGIENAIRLARENVPTRRGRGTAAARANKNLFSTLQSNIALAKIEAREAEREEPEGAPVTEETHDVWAGKRLADGSIMYAREHASGGLNMTPGEPGYIVAPKTIDPMTWEHNEVTFSPDVVRKEGIRFVTFKEAQKSNGDIYKAAISGEPEGEAPFGTERGKPREAVDESGVTERQFLAGIDRAKRMDFHKDFPQLLPGKIVEEIRELEARLEDSKLNANQIEDIKHEIDMLEEELRIIPDAADVSGVPDMTPEDVLYDRLTHAPYRLPAEQVRNIIDDYHTEGRKLLYDIEPGLGRLYDLTAKGEKYRYFEPVEGDFQLYGQGPAGTFRGKRELPKLGVKWDITNPRSLDKLTLGNLYALLDKENRFIKFEKDRLGEEESSPILQRFYDARKAYSDAIKRKTGEEPSEAGPAGTVRGRRGEPLDKWIKGTILLDSVRGQEVKKPLPEHSAIGLGRGTRWTFDPTRQVVRWTDTPTREHVDLVSEWLWKNHKVVPDRHESWITSEVLYPEYSPGGPGLGPAGTTRGRGMSKKGQEQARLNALRVAAAEGKAVPAAEAVAAMQAEAFEPVTAHRAQEFVTEYLSQAPAGAKAKLREKFEVIQVGGKKQIQKRYEPGGRVGISFEDFAAKFRTQFGAVPDSQLRELFLKNAGEALAKLPGKRLADLIRDLKIVKILTGGGKPGEKMLQNIGDPGQKGRQLELGFSSGGKALNFAVRRAATAKAKEAQYTELLNEAKAAHQAIVDAGWRDVTDKGELVALSPREKVKVRRIAAPEEIQGEVRALLEARTRLDDFVYDLIGDRPMPKPMFEPGPPRRITRHGEALRAKAIGAIVTELQKQAETSRKPVTRTEISPDELANPATAKEPVFFDIRTSELTDVDRLGQRLTSDARVAGANVEDSRRLVVLLSKESGRVTMASIWDTLKEPGVVVKLGDARTPLSAVLKTHRPVHSILLDEPVRAFRKTYSSLSEFNREFGNAARERAQSAQYEHLPMEDVEEGLGPGRGTTGRRAVPGELLEGEGQIRPSGGVAGPQAAQARMEMGIEPGELGAERRLTDAEAARTYDYATSVVKEFRSPQDFQEVLESLEMDAGELPISKQSTQVIAALNKMFHAILAKNPEFTPGQAMERLSHELYESVRASASAEPAVARARFVQSVLGRYGGAIPEVGRQAPVSPTARELAAPRPGERIRPGIEGVRPALQARPRIEGVGGGLRETMARGAQVHVTPEAATRARARRIARSGVREESRFARMVREMAEDVRQVEAEVAKEVPRLEGETTEQWVERVRENVARLEHYAATRREAGPAGTQRGKASDLWRKAQEADAIEAESVERWLFGPSRGFAEWYSGWLSQNIRRHGRVASGQAADMADVALDRVKELLAGLNPRLNDALVLSGGTKEIPLIQQVPTPKQLAATKWLNHIDIIPVGDRTTAVSRTVDAIEGNIEVPKFARSTVAAGINSNWDIGKLILEHPQGKFQRNMTARGYDVFMEGQGKEFDAIMKATVWLNATPEMRMRASPRTLEQAELELRAHWAAWRAENLKPLPDINKIEKINQDFIRKWPKVVTHVKTPYGWQQVIHTDLHNYLMNSALRTAHVAAFREQFPNTQSGHRKLAKLDREVRSELGVDHVEDWNALIKTMQGRPTDSYNRFWITGPGKNWAEAGRALNDTAMSLVRRGVLTGQMVVQVPETISAPFVFFSAKNVLRSLVRFRALLPTMISTGQVNKLVYNFSIDPANPIRSGFRFAGNVISKAYAEHFLNELQGKWFSANATVAVERLLNGEMSKRELADIKETFINTGFTPEQASRMLAGDAELLEAFQRRLPTWAVGENKLMAEGSKIAANRLFNSIFRFQMYPMTKMNQLKIILERVAETSKYGDKSEKYAARMRLAKFIGGTTFQGAFLALLYSYFSGGKEGAEMKAREAADEPVRFLTEGFLGAMGGPLYLVWSGARWGGWTGIGEQATRVVFPYAVGAEIVEASAGVGKYKDMDAWDRTAKFFSQKAPGFRMMRTMISEWALGESSPKLEANLKALSQWKRDNWKNKKFPEGPEYNREFRINMKKAYQAVIDEDPEARAKAILAAAGIKTSQGMEEGEADEAIRQSFRQRLVLVNPETGKPLNADEEESLRKRIGDEALWRLKVFDEMLRDLASEPVL